MVTSLIRAHHARCASPPLLEDRCGDVLVPQDFKDRLVDRAIAEGHGVGAPDKISLLDAYLCAIPSYASVILRSRYAEDELEKAVRSGVRQYVLVGAGFDGFCLRRPGYAGDVAVFEVDHPATQNFKRQRLADSGIAEPELTHFVAADLASESLADALRRAPFRFDQPAFFSWLGVTIYLTREVNSQALRAIAECGTRGSSLVFTYTDLRAFVAGSESDGFRRMRANAESVGEPFVTGFDPGEMLQYLATLGLELIEDLDAVRLAERYLCSEQTCMLPSSHSHVVLARCR